MNEQIEHCLYQAGLTAQGCWDELDDYAKEGIEKFAELIVRECAKIADDGCGSACFGLGINGAMLLEHFGIDQ